MKKFLCYDTNDAASGKINVSPNGVLKPNSTVPSSSGEPYKSLVTDGEGGVKWEDRLAYDDSRLVVDVRGGAQLVKVADEVPSWATVDVNIKIWLGTGSSSTLTPEFYHEFGNGSFYVNDGICFFVMADNDEYDGVVFPEKGVYFMSADIVRTTGIASAGSDTPEITWDGNIETIKTIDPKYIPSELNEVILPSSTSGSSKKFKITVDDSGTISATEV